MSGRTAGAEPKMVWCRFIPRLGDPLLRTPNATDEDGSRSSPYPRSCLQRVETGLPCRVPRERRPLVSWSSNPDHSRSAYARPNRFLESVPAASATNHVAPGSGHVGQRWASKCRDTHLGVQESPLLCNAASLAWKVSRFVRAPLPAARAVLFRREDWFSACR